MNTKTTNLIFTGLILATIAAGAILYPQLPDQIASHWNIAGEVDGYMSKFWGTFFAPMLMAFFYVLYLIIPKIDPKFEKNYKSFEREYNLLWTALMLFFVWIFAIQMTWSMNVEFNFGAALIIAVAPLWFAVGHVMQNAKRNWFVGIRTPWTLSSDAVWKKTHLLGGRLFKLAGLVALMGLFLSSHLMIIAIVVPPIAFALWTVIYSYLEYNKTKK